MPLFGDKSKHKKGPQYQNNLLYLTEVLWNITNLLFVQIKSSIVKRLNNISRIIGSSDNI